MRRLGCTRRTVVAQVDECLQMQLLVVGQWHSRAEPTAPHVRHAGRPRHRRHVARLEHARLPPTWRQIVRVGDSGGRRRLVLESRLVHVEVGRQHHDDIVVARRLTDGGLAGHDSASAEAGAVAGRLDLVVNRLAADAGAHERRMQRVRIASLRHGELRRPQRLGHQQSAEHVVRIGRVATDEGNGVGLSGDVDAIDRQPIGKGRRRGSRHGGRPYRLRRRDCRSDYSANSGALNHLVSEAARRACLWDWYSGSS